MAREELNSTVSTTVSSTDKSCCNEIAQLTSISLAIILTNAMVFVLFKFNKRLRTPANYILFSLAVSDFLTGLISIPLLAVGFASVLPQPLIKPIAYTRMVLHNLTAISGINHTVAITVERYLAITRPLSHRSGMHSKKIFKVIASVWFGSAVLASIPFAWYHEFDTPLGRDLRVAHIFVCIIFVFLLPYLFLTYAHIVMFHTISCRGQRCAGGDMGNTDKCRKGLSNDKKTIATFGIMAVVFLICWFPWFILQLLVSLAVSVPSVVYQVFLIVRYMSSILNPLLYTFLKRDFQQAVRELLCGKRETLKKGARSTRSWIRISRRKTLDTVV